MIKSPKFVASSSKNSLAQPISIAETPLCLSDIESIMANKIKRGRKNLKLDRGKANKKQKYNHYFIVLFKDLGVFCLNVDREPRFPKYLQ